VGTSFKLALAEGDYGMRATYGTKNLGGNTYMPFSRKSRRQLRKGIVPTSQYLKF